MERREIAVFMKTSLISVLLVLCTILLSGNTINLGDNGSGIVKYPPVSTFKSSCARCHGPQGASFGEDFGKLPQRDLERFIRLMMKGPGGLNPNKADIDAMIAYSQALVKHRPFIFITSADTLTNTISYSGESLPGTTLSLTSQGETLQIKTGKDGKWRTGPVAPSGHFIFIAIEKTDTVRLEPGKTLWTN